MISRRNFIISAALLPLVEGAGFARATDDSVFELPISLMGSRVAVQLTVKGTTLNFMLDTGAFASLIRQDLIKPLGLVLAGQTRFNGRTLPLYAARDVVFANSFRQSELLFAALEGNGLGDGIAGTLAAGVVTDHDSDLDFAAGRWRVYTKGREAPSPGFVALDSEIVKGASGVGSAYIFVKAALGGKRYRFLVDTGAPGTISLFNAAARNSVFAKPDTPFAPAHTANTNGAGRVSPIVRGNALDLGNGVVFNRPLVLLDQNPSWHLEGADGVIGLSLLRQLDLATDVRAGKLWVKPNGIAPRPETYARSGLWIDRSKSGVVISVVGVGSPAAAAGVQPGDTLPTLDFATALRMIQQPAGTRITLTVERGGTRREVSLTLADYL